MWGRLLVTAYNLYRTRNTPTHVGKTLQIYIALTAYQKHPHACGEDTAATGYGQNLAETPPRMWGRRDSANAIKSGIGNTPTHVGKT